MNEVQRRSSKDSEAGTRATLIAATQQLLATEGTDALTSRSIAAAADANLASITYYFGSKDHLVAEVFWRRLSSLPTPVSDGRRSPLTRVSAALRELALLIAAEPELAAASTTAILARDADVQRLRDRIGAAFNHRLTHALGADAEPAVVRALNLALAGALLQAGMGYFSYTQLADRMDEVAAQLMRGRR